MKRYFECAICMLITAALFFSCKKERNITGVNEPPVANAGTDITITLPVDSAELYGSGTDNDGSIVSYSWKKVSGPSSFVISQPNAAKTKVKALVTGSYEFELSVKDNGGLISKDVTQCY